MSRPKLLPDDVKQTCIQVVRGYDRRLRNYHNRRREILEGSPCQYEVINDKNNPKDWKKSEYFYPPSAHNASRTGENIALQLLELEDAPETKRVRAVEEARKNIGKDLPEGMRKKLEYAITLNCKSGRQHPFERLDIEGIGRTDFYARRMQFLIDIALYLELL